MKKLTAGIAVLAALMMMAPGTVQAQEEGGNLNISWTKPFMENTGFLNSAFNLNYSRSMGGWDLTIGLPFAMFEPEDEVPGVIEGQSSLGNPRIGIMKGSEGSPLMYSFGVRIPVASADNGSALMVGRLADPMYMGAWAPDNLAVDANVMYFKGGESGIAPYLQGGVEVLYDTDAPDGADTTEITVPFILGAVMPMESGGIMAGLAGNYWVTEDDGYTSDNPWLYGAVGYRFSAGSVMPEIWLALPLSSDYGEFVDFMLSIGVGFNMP